VDAPQRSGASTNALLSPVADVQTISGMPLMTAVPVKILQTVSR
jgi:hypothetical protein